MRSTAPTFCKNERPTVSAYVTDRTPAQMALGPGTLAANVMVILVSPDDNAQSGKISGGVEPGPDLRIIRLYAYFRPLAG
jgi:hypothetical protein